MRYLITIIMFLGFLSISLSQQEIGNYKVDNGESGGYYKEFEEYEETIILKPPYPGKIEEVHLYLAAESPAKDTVWIMETPAEQAMPPTMFCRHLAAYNGYIVNVEETGWYTIDVSDLNLRTGGNNSIAIQHFNDPGGVRMVIDSDNQKQGAYTSFLNDVLTPNPDFYNIRGTKVQLSQGDFIVRLTMDYDTETKPEPQLIDVTQEVGLPELRSPMASAVDWNNDGWIDIAIGNNFFENDGTGNFEKRDDINVSCFGTVWGDVDNDGYMDFFAARGSGNDKIYYGNEDGSFTEETDPVVVKDYPTVAPMWLDFDKDGDLDLFIAYGRTSSGGNETYYPDQLYENTGNREFKNITGVSGVGEPEANQARDCWGASLCDYNNDGWTDIFVATYRLAPDFLFKNNGDGTFENVADENGTEGVDTYNPNYFGHGMGSDWGDYDNDGDYDLAVGNLSHWDERALSSNKSLIMENTQNGQEFIDRTNEMNLRFKEMNGGIAWVDLNNDSWLDLVHGQISYTGINDINSDYALKPSRYYINQGPDQNYYMKDMSWYFGGEIHGAWSPVPLDYDNDGDMDLLMCSSLENVKLFRNDIKDKGNYVQIQLIGSDNGKVNQSAYGTEVEVKTANNTYKKYLPGSRLTGRAAQAPNVMHFGLGNEQKIEYIKATYPDGSVRMMEEPPVNSGSKIVLKASSVTDEIAELNLLENHPNPVTEHTNIRFELEKAGNVKIDIYDNNGKFIQNLTDNYLAEGMHSLKWIPGDLTPGVYHYTFTFENKSISKKIILQK